MTPSFPTRRSSDLLEDAQVPRFGHRPFEGKSAGLEEGVEPHHPQAHRPFTARTIFRPRHFRRRAVDIVLQHIVEEAHDILDKLPVVLPLVPGFQVEGGKTADGRAVIADMVATDRKSTRLNSVTNAHLVCRLLLETKT